MVAIILFYLAVFLTSFVFCIMPGPVALEVIHHALKKQNKHALAIGAGAVVVDALWAMVAFFGITPFLKNGQGNQLEGFFLLAAAFITLTVGALALRNSGFVQKVEKKEEEIVQKVVKRKRKRWSFLKGFTMMMVNPLGIGAWVITLSFLKKVEIYIPLTLTYEILFMFFVMAGAFSYMLLIVSVTNRVQALFTPEKTAKIIKILGYTLIAFSVYFLFFSIRALL